MPSSFLRKIVSISLSPPDKFARVYHFNQVNSVFDTAFALAQNNAIASFDSVISDCQQAGRGQMRRPWISPPGNLYATLALPNAPIFNEPCATPFLGFLCASALRKLGWPILLKWPNDLILAREERYGKVGGILLEERGKTLLAGIGINVYSSPDINMLRKDAALEAAALGNIYPGTSRNIVILELWRELVMQIFSIYKASSADVDDWRRQYDKMLLWRKRQVVARDGQVCIRGRLEGLSAAGSIQIMTENGPRECFGGDLKLSSQ